MSLTGPAREQHTDFVAFTSAVRTMLDILDTNGEESVQLADACRAVLSLHKRMRGEVARCRECYQEWPCPTLARMAEPLGVRAGADT